MSTTEAEGQARSRAGRSLVIGLVVIAVAVGATATMAYLSGRSSGSGGDCLAGVRLGGTFFEEDVPNENVLDERALGGVVAEVRRSRFCTDRDGDASELPVGTELRAVAGIDPGVAVAAVDGRRVRFYRALLPHGSQVVERMLLDDVAEAHLLAPFDTRFRLARLDDATTARLVADLLRSERVEPEYIDGRRGYVVEFVRGDGLTTSVGLDLERRVANGIFSVSSASVSAVAAAIDDLPPRWEADGLTLTASTGSAPVRPLAGCLPDRPELTVRSGETVTITGDRAGSITFVFVSGEHIESFARYEPDLDGTIDVPEGRGIIVFELSSASAQFCVVATITD